MNAGSIPLIVSEPRRRRLNMAFTPWVGWSLCIGAGGYAAAVAAAGVAGMAAAFTINFILLPAVALGVGFYMGAKQ